MFASSSSSSSSQNPAKYLFPLLSGAFLLSAVFHEIYPLVEPYLNFGEDSSSGVDLPILLRNLYLSLHSVPLYCIWDGRIVRVLSVLFAVLSFFLFGMLSEGEDHLSLEEYSVSVEKKLSELARRIDPLNVTEGGYVRLLRILHILWPTAFVAILPSASFVLRSFDGIGATFLRWAVLFITLLAEARLILHFGSILLRKGRSLSFRDDGEDRLLQCEDKVENRYSVNIPVKYSYKGSERKGWINVINPFRATMILGTPGAGKSYSVYGPFISQMVRKGYSMFVYDYKYPDLTSRVMAEFFSLPEDKRPRGMKMYFVDFDSPERSHRFNPIHPRYLQDPVDSTEMAEIIMKNASRMDPNHQDFFSLSAQCYIDLLIWFLKGYEGGKYCTFPHFIELMGRDYRQVLSIMEDIPDLAVKRNTFQDAMNDKAYQQLQGQIASARVPLARFDSKTLYWTLSGDDFSLDINDPLKPKIICVGNNPLRQSIYGTALALLTSQLFKKINVPGKRHTAILVDELPTIYLKGLDNLIGTARSNRIAVVLGAQDRSQLVRDYGAEESEVIMGTVGNLFSGSVRGRTARDLSLAFGKHEVEMKSTSKGEKGRRSENFSRQLRDVIPVQKIESLSQGCFCGYVTDNNDQRIERKTFCGELLPPPPPSLKAKVPPIYPLGRDALEEAIEENYYRIKEDINRILEGKGRI